jgi:hypothetical protein
MSAEPGESNIATRVREAQQILALLGFDKERLCGRDHAQRG